MEGTIGERRAGCKRKKRGKTGEVNTGITGAPGITGTGRGAGGGRREAHETRETGGFGVDKGEGEGDNGQTVGKEGTI